MRVIFLNIDGVLNSSASCLVEPGWLLRDERATERALRLSELVGELTGSMVQSIKAVDPTAVMLVNLLTDEGVKLVLSGSHSLMFERVSRSNRLEAMQLYLQLHGLTGELIGWTNRSSAELHGRRGLEITEWLDTFPGVEKHIVLDDGSDFYSSGCHLVKTDCVVGFTFREYAVAKKLLSIEEPSTI